METSTSYCCFSRTRVTGIASKAFRAVPDTHYLRLILVGIAHNLHGLKQNTVNTDYQGPLDNLYCSWVSLPLYGSLELNIIRHPHRQVETLCLHCSRFWFRAAFEYWTSSWRVVEPDAETTPSLVSPKAHLSIQPTNYWSPVATPHDLFKRIRYPQQRTSERLLGNLSPVLHLDSTCRHCAYDSQ